MLVFKEKAQKCAENHAENDICFPEINVKQKIQGRPKSRDETGYLKK